MRTVANFETYEHAFPITPSNTETIAKTRAIYVGGAGDLRCDMNGVAVTFDSVPVGTILPIATTQVYATGTAATNLIGLF